MLLLGAYAYAADIPFFLKFGGLEGPMLRCTFVAHGPLVNRQQRPQVGARRAITGRPQRQHDLPLLLKGLWQMQ